MKRMYKILCFLLVYIFCWQVTIPVSAQTFDTFVLITKNKTITTDSGNQKIEKGTIVKVNQEDKKTYTVQYVTDNYQLITGTITHKNCVYGYDKIVSYLWKHPTASKCMVLLFGYVYTDKKMTKNQDTAHGRSFIIKKANKKYVTLTSGNKTYYCHPNDIGLIPYINVDVEIHLDDDEEICVRR